MPPSVPPLGIGTSLSLNFGPVAESESTGGASFQNTSTSEPLRPPSTPPAPSGGPRQLEGMPLLVVFNPAARDGRNGKELPKLQKRLEREGVKMVPLETVADQGERRQKIQNATQNEMAKLSNGERLFVMPYGGDGTIWETVGEVIKAVGVDLQNNRGDQTAAQKLLDKVVFVFPKKGTASDNAVQVGGVDKLNRFPRFLKQAVEIRSGFFTVESGTNPPEVVGHTESLGSSGFLFKLRKDNLRANPKSWWNKGLISYFRCLPQAAASPYGVWGFMTEVKHFDAKGTVIDAPPAFPSAETIFAQNRFIAGIGAVPGSWLETKMVALPPVPKGLVVLAESVVRGAITKFTKFNLAGPGSHLHTLPHERRWLFHPGEQVEIKTYNRSLDPNVLGPEAKIPGTRNGESVEGSSRSTIKFWGLHITVLADTRSLAVQLNRESDLKEGKSPKIGDQNLAASIPYNRPRVIEASTKVKRIRAPFISQPRLIRLMSEHGLSVEKMPELLAVARSVTDRKQLSYLANPELTIENVQGYLKSEGGEKWLQKNQSPFKALGDRSLRGGVPLVAGIGTLYGGELLADALHLDPVGQRDLRFGLTVYLSHAINANMAPLWEVAMNRMRGLPYDFVRSRQVRVAGELLTQYTFESRASLGRALGASWRTGSLAMEAGVKEALWKRSTRWAALPGRAAWNMGQGLLLSRATELLLHDFPEDSKLRRYVPTAVFFAPELLNILAPRAALSLFEFGLIRFAAPVFASGFIADMIFGMAHRWYFGENSKAEQIESMRRAQERRERGEIKWYSWQEGLRLVAPALSAFVDSHDFYFQIKKNFRRPLRDTFTP